MFIISAFNLRIYTANEVYAGCDSMVILDIYFVNGMVTESMWGEFEMGYIEEWERDYWLGDPYQIAVKKDATGAFEEWKLWKVHVNTNIYNTSTYIHMETYS